MLRLDDKDLNELAVLIQEFRHKDAVALAQWINAKQTAQAKAETDASPELDLTPSKANGTEARVN